MRSPLFLLLLVFACKEAPPKPAEDAAKPTEETAKTAEAQAKAVEESAAASQAAFLAAYPVFMHPRCLNCHPAGDVPLVGEDSIPHPQNVKRGPDGLGLYAMKCTSCHQLTNLSGDHMPPGTPNWHLPPPETPMVFEGRTPHELALQLVDKERNGGKSLEDLLAHVERDNLVLYGWDPGDGRSKPSLTHEEFVAQVRIWIESGAVAPD